MEETLKGMGISAADLAALEDVDEDLYKPISGLDASQKTQEALGENGVNDMIALDNLDEPTILRNLELRYDRDNIYVRGFSPRFVWLIAPLQTYIGSILVAVNSFKKVKGLYENPTSFRGKAITQMPPHIYSLAEKAYAALMSSGVDQAFIISGESGAGKTESMKFICRYMASLEGQSSDVQMGILNVNVVLEAFGNAKTVYNNNSSRFGKFTELQFVDNVLVGARVREYLLEKSRVVHQASRERNYHIFYQLLAGASPEEREMLRLGSMRPADFRYLNKSGCTTIDGVNDAKMYAELREAMTMFTPEEQDDVFRTVAAVLHLGNIDFSADPSDKDLVLDVSTPEPLEAVCAVLDMPVQSLVKPLLNRTSFIRGELITTRLQIEKSRDARDALAKYLYGRLFSSIIETVNRNIAVGGSSGAPARTPGRTPLMSVADDFKGRCIGVLDIFGFENFERNSFEQFCINLANEQLQDYFNEYIFKLEQLEYKHEGLKLTEITFMDNKACLDMITEKNAGLLDVLDEQSYFPKATTDSLMQRFAAGFKGHPNFEVDRLSRSSFIVRHYAGAVSYDSSLFLEKNRDIVSGELLEAFLDSQLPFIARLFGFSGNAGGAGAANSRDESTTNTMKRRVPTVSLQFKSSLDDLMVVLRRAQPYFVRCIKPNLQQVPDSFVNDFVTKQLRYSGMLETVRIRREGFPVRYMFADFIERFAFMLPPDERKVFAPPYRDARQSGVDLVKQLGLAVGDYQFGRSKLFLRDKPAALLEMRLAQIQAQRLARLKAEVERKRKEEEERKKREEEERLAREEEERIRREEEEKSAAGLAAKKRAEEEAAAAATAAAAMAKAEFMRTRINPLEGGADSAEAGAPAAAGLPPPPPPAAVPGGAPMPPPPPASLTPRVSVAAAAAAVTAPPPPPPEPEPAAPTMQPPPPLPDNCPPRDEIESRLRAAPGWQEEKELKKLLQLVGQHEKYNEYLKSIEKVKVDADAEFNKLPPWKRDMLRKKGIDGAALVAQREATGASPVAAPAAAPAPQATPGRVLDVASRSRMRSESTFFGEEKSAAVAKMLNDPIPPEAPEIPPGTPSREELEARLAANPAWLEEKEIKRQLQFHLNVQRYHDKIKEREGAAERERQQEEAKLAQLPPWKRSQILAERQARQARSSSPVTVLSPTPGASFSAAAPLTPTPGPARSASASGSLSRGSAPPRFGSPAASASSPALSSSAAALSVAAGVAPAGGSTSSMALPPAPTGNEPAWKQAMMEKKRKEAEVALAHKQEAEAAEIKAKLDKLPAWKRAIYEKTGQWPS